MSHKITRVQGEWVEFSPPTQGEFPTTRLKREKFGVTDAALALEVGNEFEKGTPSNYITRFAPQLDSVTGTAPDIDRNPFNFVAFAGPEPWRYEGTKPHNEVSNLSGFIEFTAEALTPCFVPEGFPVAAGDSKAGDVEWTDDELRDVDRRFCRMVNSGGEERYCIPGASFKGALRSAVEAVANSRFGVLDDKNKSGHVYRRRVFKAGVVLGPEDGSGDCKVKEIQFPRYGGSTQVPNQLGLLASQAKDKPASKYGDFTGRICLIPRSIVHQYMTKVITHPHYREHWDREFAKDSKDKYYASLTEANWADALRLKVGDVIYFTCDSSGGITNFGKNVNYLWPARSSLPELTKHYHPREQALLGDSRTDLAEYLFGAATPHKRDQVGNVTSEPFGGQVRIEVLWGPKVGDQALVPVTLAPLTSPQSKGKSRPLYLAPGSNGLSASFDDRDAAPRGRKFYWHQKPPEGARLWAKHEFQGTGPVDKELRKAVRSQCPPSLQALPAGVQFSACIHFSNLDVVALGAVLYALTGDGGREWAFHIGKGKPRGLGSFRIEVRKLIGYRVTERYRKLAPDAGRVEFTKNQPKLLAAFRDWCAAKAGLPKETPLSAHPHLRDYANLHTWPIKPRFRYYPLNFNQYSWLPGDDDAAGEPKPPKGRGKDPNKEWRPKSMRKARDVEP